MKRKADPYDAGNFKEIALLSLSLILLLLLLLLAFFVITSS